MHLSIVIPAYNEEKRLPKTLKAVAEYLKKQQYESEIIVVDGGSTDKTARIVWDMIKDIKNLRLLEVPKSQGKGHSVKEGMVRAKGDFRIFADADNSTPIEQIDKMWPEFDKGFDVVIGSRDIKGAVLDPPQPWLRKVLLGEGFKIYRKIVLGLWGIEDTQCGFKGFTKEATEKVFPKSVIGRFAFDPEVLILARKMGYKIKEIPILWKNDLESKVGLLNVFKMALDILRIRINLLKGVYGKKEK